VGGAIAAQYGSSTGQKQQYFGKIDPFVMFAVLPLVMIAILFIWSDIAILGVVLIILALLVVGVDSWANRPVKKAAPARDRDDY
jgi:hypothetical protein